MRVVHVSPADTHGGAARGAYNLHMTLRSAGVDSIMLVQRKYSDEASVVARGGRIGRFRTGLRDRLDRLPLKLYRWERENWWTVGWMPYDICDAIDRLAPDVINFHGVGWGAAPIETMARLRRYPLVWTLRDLWALTGGCHYTAGCERYLTGCGACPQLRSHRTADLSRWQWGRKSRAWADLRITFVGISRWIADCAARSPLTFENDIMIIPNGIDTACFAPADKVAARTAWNLPTDRLIIMFGALHSTTDPRKGYRYLGAAAQLLADLGWRERAMIVVFGNDTADEPSLKLDTRFLGRVDSDAALAQLYSCADVMVVPSTEEAFGKTAAEAMACGVPVVGFAETGLADIVDHHANGYLAARACPADLAQGIAWTLNHVARDADMPSRAREKIVQHFNTHDVAWRYACLYERLVAQRDENCDRARSSFIAAAP